MTRVKTSKTKIRQDTDRKTSSSEEKQSGKVANLSSYHYSPERQEVLYFNTKNSKMGNIPADAAHEKELKEASMRTAIDELLNKAKSYPKVEGYLRGLDKRRIDEGEDIPVTKREKAVRQADENAAKRLESQGKSMSLDDRTVDYISKCHSHVLESETFESLKAKKKQAPKAKDHVFGNDPNDKRGSEYEMVEVKEPDAYKSHNYREDYKTEKKGKGKIEIRQLSGEDLPFNPKPRTDTITTGRKNQIVSSSETNKRGKTSYEVMNRSEESDLEKAKSRSAMGQYDEKVVRALKKKPGVKNPFALATAIKEGTVKHKSEESNLVKSIDVLLEKAMFGPGTREGKIYVQGTHKNPKSHGKVSTPQLSEARKKEIIEGSRKKALTQAETGGLYAQAAKIRAEKSLDERTCDLVKALNVDYGPRKSGVKRGGSRQDPDAGIDRKKEEAMDRQPVFLEERNRALAGPKDTKTENKSLDERTCDLHKGFTPKKVGHAIGQEYIKNPDSEKAKRVAVKFHSKNLNNPKASEDFSEGMTDAIWAHNLKLAKKSLQDVVNAWQTDSPFITKGAKVMPLGPGGDVQDLSKDEVRRSGGRTPSYQQTDEKQRDVESGKIERERKAKKRISDLGAE